MEKQSSDSPARMVSPADFPIGSPESRAAARMMARNQCQLHVYGTNAEAEAAAAAHGAGLVACLYGSNGPFISLEGIPETDAVSG
jgi:hypothetical protein